MSFTELETEVLLGKLDLALTFGSFENSRLTQLELMQTPLYIALPEWSPLAGYKELELSQLNQKTWLLSNHRVHPFFSDSVLRTAAQEGVQPRSIHSVVTAEEAAQDLYAGTGEVAFLTRAGCWRIARNGLTMRPLKHRELVISSKLIARSEDSSKIVSEFTRALKGNWRGQNGLSSICPCVCKRLHDCRSTSDFETT